MSRGEKRILAICLTILYCISLGIALHSWTGVCVGICMGAAFGLFDSEEIDNEGQERKGH